MHLKPLVILGSARGDGETFKALELAFPNDKIDILNLLAFNIALYDYNRTAFDDDFLHIVERLIKTDDIVFATPVYWYAMSAGMKILFDRFSDLITHRKELGRALAKKRVWLLATGTDIDLPEGFEIPFRKTCAYFNMEYRESYYLYTRSDNKTNLAVKERSHNDLRTWGKNILLASKQGISE